jgi:AraC-like DNA-binding protein
MTIRDREILVAVRDYIDLNFLNPNSLESLSRQFGLNEFKLKHGFKTLFDTSPIRYLQKKRLFVCANAVKRYGQIDKGNLT